MAVVCGTQRPMRMAHGQGLRSPHSLIPPLLHDPAVTSPSDIPAYLRSTTPINVPRLASVVLPPRIQNLTTTLIPYP